MVVSKQIEKKNTSYKNCNNENIIMFISFIIGIIINIVIINSLNNIEKNSNCKCTDLPHRKFLKEWFITLIIINICILLAFTISNENCWKVFINYPYIYTIVSIVGIINIIMLIRLFLYIRLLRKTCECAYNTTEKIIYWYLLILISIWISIFVLAIILALLTFIKFIK